MADSVVHGENGLCIGGRERLVALTQRMERQEETTLRLDIKMDRNTQLLIATLVTALLDLVYLLLKG